MQKPQGTPGTETPSWFVPTWLEVDSLPTFAVVDTRSAQGRLDQREKIVTVRDLILFHGHACDGLLRGVWAMRALADIAFGASPLDRSDLMVVSKNSPCLGDVAAYLTGARVRFGTHRLDDDLGLGFIVQRCSTGETWEVREEAGFFPPLIAAWEAALLRPDLDPDDKAELLAVHEAAQWDWVRSSLLPSAPREHYCVSALAVPELPAPLHTATRTDTVNRLVHAPRTVTTRYEPVLDAKEPRDPQPRAWVERYLQGPEAALATLGRDR
jgi:formylmethanofuran dehydrogenase subunit E